MEESYGEGLASHTGPESWGCFRKGAFQALTGARAGRVLSREIISAGCRRCDRTRKATPSRPQIARPCWDLARSKTPRTFGTSLRENRESPWFLTAVGTVGRVGKSKDVIQR